jgi:hypothetical protein
MGVALAGLIGVAFMVISPGETIAKLTAAVK